MAKLHQYGYVYSECGSQMHLGPARRQLTRGFPKIACGQIAIDPNQIGAIEEVEKLPSPFDLQPLANSEDSANRQIEVVVAFVVIGISTKVALLTQSRYWKIGFREQAVEVLALPRVAKMPAKAG